MQKYKIYINETPLILTSSDRLNPAWRDHENVLVAAYNGRPKQFFPYIDMLEKSNTYRKVVIHYHDYPRLKEDWKSLFIVVKAGGGLVINPADQVLFIYRRGYWDLPKGKIDDGESKKEAAGREVGEETGINEIRIGSRLIKTKHLYRDSGGKRCLKITSWYLMFAPAQSLIPQTEEDIELAEWKHPIRFLRSDPRIYGSIRDVLRAYFEYGLQPAENSLTGKQ